MTTEKVRQRYENRNRGLHKIKTYNYIIHKGTVLIKKRGMKNNFHTVVETTDDKRWFRTDKGGSKWFFAGDKKFAVVKERSKATDDEIKAFEKVVESAKEAGLDTSNLPDGKVISEIASSV